MTELITALTNEYRSMYFTMQFTTILAIYCYGFVMISVLGTKTRANEFLQSAKRMFVAFPFGTALFSLLGIIILILRIPYGVASLLVMSCILLVLAIFMNKPSTDSINAIINKQTITVLALAIALAIVSTSGIISVIFSNDAMYMYSLYPANIVKSGKLIPEFDMYLTDTGLATAVLNTTPYLFGFNETFGIQTMFNFCFIGYFACAIYEQACDKFSKRVLWIITVLGTLLLATSMPFAIISKWNIANVYFMEYIFIALYMSFEYHTYRDGDEANHNALSDKANCMVLVILLMVISYTRVEGAIFAALVILLEHLNKEISIKVKLIHIGAVLVIQSLYWINILFIMKTDISYAFMTKQKYLLIIFMLIAIAVYMVLYDKYGAKIINKLPVVLRSLLTNEGILYILVLTAGNGLLLVYSPSKYLNIIKSFIDNMTGNSGWGFFAAVVVSLIILVPKNKKELMCFEVFTICFFLAIVISCYFRGGELRESIGDSGNRVLLQIVPFVVYSFVYRFIVSNDVK